MRHYMQIVESAQTPDTESFIRDWGEYVLEVRQDDDDFIEENRLPVDEDERLRLFYSECLKYDIPKLVGKTLYRGVRVPRNWLEMLVDGEIEHVGQFWSMDKSVSQDFSINGAKNLYDDRFQTLPGSDTAVIMEMVLSDLSVIDLNPTIAVLVASSNTEAEIRINPGVEIIITALTVNGKRHARLINTRA